MRLSQARGFSLIELMVTIAVVAILAAIALPSFKSTLDSNNVSTTANELLASVSLARSEGIRNNEGAGICHSASGTSCLGTWNDGWLVWSDLDGNGNLDGNEPIIRYSQNRGKTTVTSAANEVVFDTRGRSTAGAQVSLNMKPSSGTYPLRCLVVNATGQTYIKKDAC